LNATSRKFIYDAMAVQLSDKVVMAASVYPKEANPLWGETSTITVAHTLKATLHIHLIILIRVFGIHQGMEYPMICWNFCPDANE
jgi:hypothetical protein